MKKTIIITAALMLAGVNAFSQGFISWAGGSKGIWNDVAVNQTFVVGSGMDVALLFYTANPGAGLTTAGIGITGSATNGSSSFTASQAWTALTAPSPIVVDGAPSLSSTPATAGTTAAGSFVYNGSAAWNSLNLTGGTTYWGVEVAWDTEGGTITTLAGAEAAAATDAMGYSQVFTYQSAATSPTATVLGLSTVGSYGVYAPVAPVPEPMTAALAGLGGLALLGLRRKK